MYYFDAGISFVKAAIIFSGSLLMLESVSSSAISDSIKDL